MEKRKKSNIIRGSLFSLLLLFTSNTCVAMTVETPTLNVITQQQIANDNANAAKQTANDNVIAEKESIWTQWLEEYKMTEDLLSASAQFQTQGYLDNVMDATSKFGGKYGEEVKGAIEECYNIKVPDFSASLNIPGLSWCPSEYIKNMVVHAMRGETVKFNKENFDNFKESLNPLPHAKIGISIPLFQLDVCVTGASQSSNAKERESILKLCEERTQEELTTGRKDGAVNPQTTEKVASGIALTPDDKGGIKTCKNSENSPGTAASMACTEPTVNSVMRGQKTRENIANGTHYATATTIGNLGEKLAEISQKNTIDATARVNTQIDIRDEYNKKFNPTKFAITDVENMGDEATYSKMKKADEDTLEPTLYIVPVLDETAFSFNKYGIDNYDDAIEQFNKLSLDNGKDMPFESGSPEKIADTVKRLGGVTPFSSALYGYEAMLTVMAKNMYSDGSDNGEVGMQLAQLNGLKGVMYQLLMVNQQLENRARTDYNINIKQYEKISADNDKMNNNLEVLQAQNAAIINLLKEMNDNLRKISAK